MPIVALEGATPDYSTIAGLYSQLAGVLAGFAFAGLVALIAAQLTSDTKESSSVESFTPLVSSFIGLISTSLSYAIIAGEGSGNGRSAILETVGGTAFGVAGLTLFYSLLVLIHGVYSDAATAHGHSATVARVVAFTRHILIFGIAPAVILPLWGGIAGQEAVKYGEGAPLHSPDYVSGAALLAVFIFAALKTLRNRNLPWAATPPSPTLISAVSIALSLCCLGAITIIGVFAPVDGVGPDIFRVLEVLTLLAFTIAVIRSAARYR
jgi:hypothetical protein